MHSKSQLSYRLKIIGKRCSVSFKNTVGKLLDRSYFISISLVHLFKEAWFTGPHRLQGYNGDGDTKAARTPAYSLFPFLAQFQTPSSVEAGLSRVNPMGYHSPISSIQVLAVNLTATSPMEGMEIQSR